MKIVACLLLCAVLYAAQIETTKPNEVSASNLALGLLQRLKTKYNDEILLKQEEVDEACTIGQLEFLKVGYEYQGLIPGIDALNKAALNAHLPVLKYVFEKTGVLPDESVIPEAEELHRGRVVKFIRNEYWNNFVAATKASIDKRMVESKKDVNIFELGIQNGGLKALNEKILLIIDEHGLEPALPLLMFAPNFSSDKMIDDIREAVNQNLYGFLKCCLAKTNEIADEKDRAWFLALSYESPWYDPEYWMLHWIDANFGRPDLIPSVFASGNHKLFARLKDASFPKKFPDYNQFPVFDASTLDHVLVYDSHEALRFFFESGVLPKDIATRPNMVRFIKSNCVNCLELMKGYGHKIFKLEHVLGDNGSLNEIGENGYLKMAQYIDANLTGDDALDYSNLGKVGLNLPCPVYYSAIGGQHETLDFFLEKTGYQLNRIVKFMVDSDLVDRAAKKGEWKMVKYFYEKFGWLPSKVALDVAFVLGHTKVVKLGHKYHMAEKETEPWTPKITSRFPRDRFAHDLIHFYAIDLGLEMTPEDLEYCNLVVVKHVHERDGVLPTQVDHPAIVGRFDVLEYVHRHAGILPSSNAIKKAASHGHIRVLDYIHKIDPEYTLSSLSNLKPLINRKTPISYDIVKFLSKKLGRSLNSLELRWAVRFGSLDVVVFVHETSGLLPSQECLDSACKYGHIDIIKYVHEENDTLPSIDGLDLAAAEGHLPILEFVHSLDPSRIPSTAGLNRASVSSPPRLDVIDFMFEVSGQLPSIPGRNLDDQLRCFVNLLASERNK